MLAITIKIKKSILFFQSKLRSIIFLIQRTLRNNFLWLCGKCVIRWNPYKYYSTVDFVLFGPAGSGSSSKVGAEGSSSKGGARVKKYVLFNKIVEKASTPFWADKRRNRRRPWTISLGAVQSPRSAYIAALLPRGCTAREESLTSAFCSSEWLSYFLRIFQQIRLAERFIIIVQIS